MKHTIDYGDMYLAIFNESNNWLMTNDKNKAEMYCADDQAKCAMICFRPSTFTLHITVVQQIR